VRLALLLLALVGGGDRTVVYSVPIPKDQVALRTALGRVKGVTGVGLDAVKGELTARLAGAGDKGLLEALRGQGLKPVALPARTVGGPDTLLLTPDGSAVGSLEALRVPGKYTVFDVFAEWCLPCTIVDKALTRLLGERSDVAVRRLNIVSFDSPLAVELDLDALPHMVVFSPNGRRTEIDGADLEALADSLKAP
jgi:hypothetical protein